MDFHWGEYTYNLAGGNEILLSELLRILGTSITESTNEGEEASEERKQLVEESKQLLALAEDMSRIENVWFSNLEFVKVEKKSSEQAEIDWLLTSLAPFDTEEVLTITFTDGSELKIRVTDEVTDAIARVSNDNGATWTEFDYLVTTDDNQGAFDYVKTLSGDVIVELLKETHEQYTLTSGITIGNGSNNFNGTGNPAIKHLTIRSANADTPAKIVKNHTAPLLTVNIRSCNTTIENLFIDGGSVATAAHGGALQFATNDKSSNNGNAAPTATVRNLKFKNCYAMGGSYVGGAVYSKCPLTLENCSFDDCRASSHGGAVYADTAGTVYIKNGATLKDCYAGGNDGAVYTSTSIVMNSNAGTLMFDTCHAYTDGGALFSPTVTMDDNSGTITFTGCYTTNGNGEGGAAFTSASFSGVNNQGTIIFTGCYTTGSSSEGGALFGNSGSITLKCAENGTLRFENLTANASDGGGAICGWSGCVVTIEGTAEHPVEFENCVAKNCGDSRGGGAVYCNAGSGSFKYVNVNNCKSKFGGAFASSVNMTLTDCVITNCTQNESNAIITKGGAIHVSGGTTTLNNCTITGCQATNGGAINVNSGTVVMNGGEISDNTATTNGGAANIAGSFTMNGGRITDCEAAKGAAVFTSGTFTLNSGEISGNNATNSNGGTVQTNGGSGTLRFKGAAKVKGNTINSAAGQNVYLENDRASAVYADGLSAEAEIHIFVTDSVKGKRGYAGRSFGYYTNDANLDRMINERYRGPDGSSPLRGEAVTNYDGGRLLVWKGEDTVLTVVSSEDGTTPVGAGARFELRRGRTTPGHS